MAGCKRCALKRRKRGKGKGREEKRKMKDKMGHKIIFLCIFYKGNRKTMNRNWINQKANPALKTKTGNK